VEDPTIVQAYLGSVDDSENPLLSIAAAAWVMEKVALNLTAAISRSVGPPLRYFLDPD
jgi:hypothetical protein